MVSKYDNPSNEFFDALEPSPFCVKYYLFHYKTFLENKKLSLE